MIFFDIIFLGVYYVLDKIYSFRSDRNPDFGPKQHSSVISVGLHTMNLQTLLNFISITYFHRTVNLYAFSGLVIILIIIGYLIYYKGKRIERILNKPITVNKKAIYVIISIVYIVVSSYLMIIAGNHGREALTGESVDTNRIHLIGVYYATPNINTFDTLKLNNKGEYVHAIYRKKDSSLVFKNVGKWDVEIDRVILNNFLLNKDEKYNEGENNFKNLPTYSFPYKNPLGTATIPFGERTNDYFYTKNK